MGPIVCSTKGEVSSGDPEPDFLGICYGRGSEGVPGIPCRHT